jgi:hypothetical protein
VAAWGEVAGPIDWCTCSDAIQAALAYHRRVGGWPTPTVQYVGSCLHYCKTCSTARPCQGSQAQQPTHTSTQAPHTADPLLLLPSSQVYPTYRDFIHAVATRGGVVEAVPSSVVGSPQVSGCGGCHAERVVYAGCC